MRCKLHGRMQAARLLPALPVAHKPKAQAQAPWTLLWRRPPATSSATTALRCLLLMVRWPSAQSMRP